MKLKLKSILLLIFFTVFTGTLKAAPAPFTITGTIKGLPDGTRINLIPGATHADEKPAATAIVNNGQFVIKGTIGAEPRLFYLRTAGITGGTSIMVQSAKITLTATAQLSGNGENKYYDFTNVVIKGSNAHLLYLKKVMPKAELNALYLANEEANKAVVAKRNEAYANKDTVLANSIMQSPAWRKLEADDKEFFRLADEKMYKVISDNKDTFWGPLLALDLFSYFTPDNKSMYASLSPQAKNSYYGKIMGELVNPKGFKGTPAPAIDVKDEVGVSQQLATLIKGHKYVLVDFWASWCVPCRKSIPNLKKAYAEFQDKGLQIVSISIDKKEGDWLKAQGEEKLPWPSFLDKGATANAWKIQAIPAMFLLDENGTVVMENMSLEEVITKLKAI